jgi:hypothetical protein
VVLATMDVLEHQLGHLHKEYYQSVNPTKNLFIKINPIAHL